MLGKEKHAARAYPENIRTIVGEGTHFKGVLTFDGSARLDGNLEGEIISEGTLVVGGNSVIKANIKVSSVTVGGKVCGDITAMDRLVILSTAEVSGNIQANNLQIEEGAKFQGTCRMESVGKDTKLIPHDKTDNRGELQAENKHLKKAA